MRALKLIAALSLSAVVSACGSVDTASRNAPFEATGTEAASQPEAQAVALPSLNVKKVNVTVPETLKVSEANRYYPSGDIVWREDPIGNRHSQVRMIVETAMNKGVQEFSGDIPVVLDIEVLRFHALTEKARFAVGGVHSLKFKLVIRDAKTGQNITQPRIVQADLDAFGGEQALAAEARGQTQKVRITDHLAEVIRQELTRPGGYQNANLGLIQQLNNI